MRRGHRNMVRTSVEAPKSTSHHASGSSLPSNQPNRAQEEETGEWETHHTYTHNEGGRKWEARYRKAEHRYVAVALATHGPWERVWATEPSAKKPASVPSIARSAVAFSNVDDCDAVPLRA